MNFDKKGVSVSFRFVIFLILLLIIAVFVVIWSIGGFDTSSSLFGEYTSTAEEQASVISEVALR